MIRTTVTLRNKRGLHARASARLNDLAGQFESRIQLIHDGRTADARNMMSIMMLAAPCGTEIGLEVEGADEADALAAIESLVNNRFDEDV